MSRKKNNAATDSVQPAAASAVQPAEKATVIVCAYPGTEDLIRSVWEKFLTYGSVHIVSIQSDDLLTTAALLAEDDSIADEFILVPPGTFPCAKVSRRELYTPLVYVSRSGVKTFAHRLPHRLEKKAVLAYLSSAQMPTAEEFCRGQLEDAGLRAVEVGYAFGNYVCPILRGNPCEHLVLEAFLRRRFIVSTLEGFTAVRHLVTRLAEG